LYFEFVSDFDIRYSDFIPYIPNQQRLPMHSTSTILAPKTILQAISQLQLPGTTLQNLFGWGMSGTNRLRQSGRSFAFDVFDHTRKVATARVPGQAASRQKPQKVGTTSGVFPRAAETIPLLD
jgi:hypothetical protein